MAKRALRGWESGMIVESDQVFDTMKKDTNDSLMDIYALL